MKNVIKPLGYTPKGVINVCRYDKTTNDKLEDITVTNMVVDAGYRKMFGYPGFHSTKILASSSTTAITAATTSVTGSLYNSNDPASLEVSHHSEVSGVKYLIAKRRLMMSGTSTTRNINTVCLSIDGSPTGIIAGANLPSTITLGPTDVVVINYDVIESYLDEDIILTQGTTGNGNGYTVKLKATNVPFADGYNGRLPMSRIGDYSESNQVYTSENGYLYDLNTYNHTMVNGNYGNVAELTFPDAFSAKIVSSLKVRAIDNETIRFIYLFGGSVSSYRQLIEVEFDPPIPAYSGSTPIYNRPVLASIDLDINFNWVE